MRLLVSRLRDFVDIDRPAEGIAQKAGRPGLGGASIERLDAGDAVIDFEVTANRPDCLSVIGFAREVATIYNVPLSLPSVHKDAPVRLETLAAGANDQLRVAVEDEDLCPRYAAASAEVRVGASPDWMV